MGAGGSVMSSTGGGVPPQISCLGGENFQAKVSMLKETPLGKVLSEHELAYFSNFFTLETLAPHCHVPMCAGELLVVGEGEVQVYVIQSGLDTKTGEHRFILCTKRKGDLIWVPTVTRLAKQKSNVEQHIPQQQQQEQEQEVAVPGGLDGDAAAAAAEGAEGNNSSSSNNNNSTGTPANTTTTDTTTTTATGAPTGAGAGKHKNLYNLLDTTFIDSVYGATLLKLDRRKYEDLTNGTGPPDDALGQMDLSALRRVIECNMEDYLRKVPLFRDIPPAKLAVLGEMCNYEFVKAGERVCSEGEAGNEIFIVLDGHLAVFTSNSGEQLPLATLGPGDYFGELAALIRIKRIATVVSTEDTLLASIKRHDFRSFMTIMPDVRFAMDKVVKEHLLYKYSKVGTRFFSSSAGGTAESVASSPSPKTIANGAAAGAGTSGANNATSRRPAFYTLCEVEDVDADRILFYEHDAPGPIYFLAEGQVRLFRKEEHDGVVQHKSIVLTAGSLVGARAVVLNEPQQYTAVTDQVCVFLKLGPAAIAQHFADHPEVKATLEILFKERAMPLAKLLECHEAHKAFATHLKEEFNEEHLVFYDDVLVFEKLMAPPPPQQQGQGKAVVAAVDVDVAAATAKLEHIQQNHLASSAPSQVNIPDAMRRRFLTAYELKEETETELARLRRLSLALEEVKREVQALLERDNYARFKNSEAFTQLLHTLQSVMPTEPGKGGGGGGGSVGDGGAMAGVATTTTTAAAAGANNKKSSGSGQKS